MDKFFIQKYCDRCGGDLSGGRIMSMFNEECICMSCKDKERQREDYQDANEAVREHEKTGDRNFPGIGF